MESRIAIPKKAFVSEEENYCDEEISFTQQDRIGNINWCKCGCDRKPMETFAESCCCRDTNKIQRYSTMQFIYFCGERLVKELIFRESGGKKPAIFLKN